MTTGMTNIALGANSRVAYLVQSSVGEIPTSPEWKVLPVDNYDPQVQHNQLENNALKGTRDRLKPRAGTVNAMFNASGRFYPDIYDDLLSAGLQSAWGQKFSETSIGISVNATNKTFTRSSGSWLDHFIIVGDDILFAGFTEAGEGGNNGLFEVTAVTESVLTFGNATGLADTAAERSVTATTPYSYLMVGSDRSKVAVEVFYSDVGEYQRFVNVEVASISISVDSQGDAIINFSLTGGAELNLGANIGDEIAGATYTYPGKNFFDSFSGSLRQNNTQIATVTSIGQNFDNQSNPLFIIGSRYPGAVSHGTVNGNFDITVFYADNEIKEKFQSEEVVSIEVNFTNDVGNDYNVFSIYYPKAKVVSYSRPVGGDTEIVQNLTLQPFKFI